MDAAEQLSKEAHKESAKAKKDFIFKRINTS